MADRDRETGLRRGLYDAFLSASRKHGCWYAESARQDGIRCLNGAESTIGCVLRSVPLEAGVIRQFFVLCYFLSVYLEVRGCIGWDSTSKLSRT